MNPQKYKVRGDRQGALCDVFGEAANKPPIAVYVFHVIHDGFDKPYAKSAFSFFVYQVIQRWFRKFIDVKHLPVIDYFKNQFAFSRNIDGEFQEMIGVAVVCVNHEVRAHFIQGQDDLVEHNIGRHMSAQGLPDEIPNALQVLQAATDFMPIAH